MKPEIFLFFLILLVVLLLVGAIFTWHYIIFNRKAKRAGSRISVSQYALMLISPISMKILPDIMINMMIMGLEISIKDLNKHHRAKGDVKRAAQAMVAARHQANIKIKMTDLTEFNDVGITPDVLLEILINCKKVGLTIPKEELKKYAVALKEEQKLTEIDQSESKETTSQKKPKEIVSTIEPSKTKDIEANQYHSESQNEDLDSNNEHHDSRTAHFEQEKKHTTHTTAYSEEIHHEQNTEKHESGKKTNITNKHKKTAVAHVEQPEEEPHKPLPGIKEAVDLLIRLHRADIKISLSEFSQYSTVYPDLEELINSIIRSKTVGITLTSDELRAFPSNGNILRAIQLLIKARQAGIDLTLRQLGEYYNLGIEINALVSIMIKSRQAGLPVSLTDIREYFIIGGDVKKAIAVLIKSNKVGILVTLKELKEFHLAKGDVEVLINTMIKAYQAGLSITFDELVSHFRAGGDIEELINAYIKSHEEGLGISLKELIAFYRAKGSIPEYFEAMKMSIRNKLDIEGRLFQHHLAGGDVLGFANAIRSAKSFNISPKELEADSIAGRNVGVIIRALYLARDAKVPLDYKYSITIDRSGYNVYEAVKWAINPKIVEIPEIEVVAQNGIQLRPKISIMIRGKIRRFFSVSKEEVVIDRVKETVVSEIGYYESHEKVMENLDRIAKDVKKILEEETEINDSSAYEILDITIPDVKIGNDAYSDLKKVLAEKEQLLAEIESKKRRALAEALEKEAEAEVIQAKAQLEKGMAEAFKQGNLNLNEYHKKKMNEK